MMSFLPRTPKIEKSPMRGLPTTASGEAGARSCGPAKLRRRSCRSQPSQPRSAAFSAIIVPQAARTSLIMIEIIGLWR
jgi:hypothetical protein